MASMTNLEWQGTNPKTVRGTRCPQHGAFFNNEEFSDVQLYCGRRQYFGHKIILSSCSEVFRTMLSTAWCNVDHLELEESCPMEEVFDQFLKFLYSWEIVLNEENVTPLLMLADKYMVEDLISLGIDYMRKNLSRENVIPWYKFSLQFNIDALYQKCMTFISHNFEDLANSKELLELESNELVPILDSGAIVTTSEMKIFTFIIDWLKCCDRGNQEDIVEQMHVLLKQVRFPMLYPRELDAIEKIPEIREGALPKIIPELYMAYKFHSMGGPNLDPNHEKVRYFIPRIYTDRCGAHVSADKNTKTFHTTIHLSQLFHTKTISWTYNQGTDYLLVSYLNTGIAIGSVFSCKVRIVIMSSRMINGIRHVLVKYDSVLTLSRATTQVYMGFAASADPDVKKHGLTFSIQPVIV